MGNADALALVGMLDDAIARRDVGTLRERVVTDGVEWVVPGRHPLAGRKRGPEEIVAYQRLLERARIRVETTALAAIDAETVVRVQHTTGEAAGVTLDSMELLVYQIQEGRVSRVQAFLGDQHPVDLYYWAAFRLTKIPDCLAGS
jgi:ketosteroid isomerase-like protein